MGVVAFLAALLLLPVLCYGAYGSSPLVWGRIAEGHRRLRADVYRSHLGGPETRWIEGHPPWIVRIAAFTSFCLGQMILPGIPGAVLMIVVAIASTIEGPADPLLMGLALSMPSAIFVAVKLLGAGIGLLQRGPHAAARARSAAAWELGHNAALCAYLLGIVGLGGAPGDEAHVCGLLAALDVLAMLHAGLLFRAANALDAYDLDAAVSEASAVVA